MDTRDTMDGMDTMDAGVPWPIASFRESLARGGDEAR